MITKGVGHFWAGQGFFCFLPNFVILFAIDPKVVLVSNAGIWRPTAPSFLASLTPLKCLLLVLFCQIIHVQHFQSFFLHGETIKTFTRLTDTLLDTSLMDWTSQLELSLAKFDITVWMSVGRFSQTPCTHITTLCWSWKPCNSHYETNALCI